jgi:hypothetical protein
MSIDRIEEAHNNCSKSSALINRTAAGVNTYCGAFLLDNRMRPYIRCAAFRQKVFFVHAMKAYGG